MRSWLAGLIVVFVACVRTSPQPAPPPPPPAPVVNVPEGCLGSLEGTWVHASDPSYEYFAADDGGTLSLVVKRHFVADAGFSPRRFRRLDAGTPDAADAGVDAGMPDAGSDAEGGSSIRIELQRTAAGFVGFTLSPLTHPSGRTCDARFPTSVISCGDAGLMLEATSATALGDECQPPSRPQDVPHVQHLLIRPAP